MKYTMVLKITTTILIAVVLLSACSKPTNTLNPVPKKGNGSPTASPSQVEDIGFIGYVVKIEGDRILVVAPEAVDYSSTGGQNNYYPATWFGDPPSTIEVGMKVEAWAVGGMFDDSYPGQATAERVSVIADNQVEGTELTEAEAVSQAILSLELEENQFTVVKKVEYDASASEWTVYVLDESRDTFIPVKVSDTQAQSGDLLEYKDDKFKIVLQYPSDWSLDISRQPSVRYVGSTGFVQLDATGSGPMTIDDIASMNANHKLNPYGTNPEISQLEIDGQDARLIKPSTDQPEEMEHQACLIV